MAKVLIAVDGTDLDRTVTRSAHGLFGDQSTYVVVNVADGPASFAAYPLALGAAAVVDAPRLAAFGDGLDELADEAEAVAEDAAEGSELGHVVVVGEVGDPVEVILHAASEYDVDVIAVGHHERSWLAKLFDRSVSEMVERLAKRPVLIVHDDGTTRLD